MSTIKANDIQNASGGIPTVKGQQLIPTAWVNFNGENTVATAAANANYSVVVAGSESIFNKSIGSLTTAGFITYVRNDDATWKDAALLTAIVMGGQA